MTTNEQIPPVACTLTTKALASQLLDWDDLRGLALHASALPNGSISSYALNNADQVADLAQREMTCCGSWLTIRTWSDHEFHLEVTTTNTEGVALIQSMAGCGSASAPPRQAAD